MQYQLMKHISLTQVDDEAVLLDLNAGTYFGLNAVGAAFLGLLQAQHSVEHAVSEIQAQFDAAPSLIQQDLNELVVALLEQKLIRVSEELG